MTVVSKSGGDRDQARLTPEQLHTRRRIGDTRHDLIESLGDPSRLDVKDDTTTGRGRVPASDNPRKDIHMIIRRSLFTATIVLVATLAITYRDGTPVADAHTPSPAVCQAAWQAAPVGSKWQALQRCKVVQKKHICVTHPRFVPDTVRIKRDRTNWNQRHVVGWLVSESLRRNMPRKVTLAALATTTTEAKATELSGGHGTSVGPFQLIDIHGTAAQRRTIEFSGNWFLNGAIRSHRRNPNQTIVALSHSVQASGHPHAVAQWVSEARRNLTLVLGPCRLR